MKTIVFILISYLVLTCSDMKQNETSNFQLKLQYDHRERSKDSNSQTTTLNIKNRIIDYSVTHGGRNARPNIATKFEMTEETENKLIEYIKQQELNRNIKEHIKDVSPGINGSVILEIKIDSTTTKSDISGAVNPWGSEEYLKKQNKKTLKHKKYYEKIHSLLVFMKLYLGFEEIEI